MEEKKQNKLKRDFVEILSRHGKCFTLCGFNPVGCEQMARRFSESTYDDMKKTNLGKFLSGRKKAKSGT